MKQPLAGAGLALALFVVLAVVVTATDPSPTAFDSALHTWALDHQTPALTDVAIGITRTGVGLTAYALAVVAGLLGARLRDRRRRWLGPLIALGALLGVQLVRQVIVQAIDRPRPPTADWALTASGAAFPSGHTTTSATVAALFCLALLGFRGRRAAVRRTGAALAVTWAVVVGVTRVYLGVHWPTDVLGGWLLASAFALTGVAAVRFCSGRTSQADDHDDT